jgi:hypothetical protein
MIFDNNHKNLSAHKAGEEVSSQGVKAEQRENPPQNVHIRNIYRDTQDSKV